MPPLAELSVNLPGKSKQASLNGASITSGKGKPSKTIPESHVFSLPTASAVQSMLKTSTEMGDIGPFAVKPAKNPRQRANTVNQPRPHRQDQFRGPHVDRPVRSSSNQHRYYHAHRDQYERSLHRNRSLRPYGGHPMVPNGHNDSSGSFTQSSVTSRRVSIQPSLPNLQPYDRAGPKPRSPFGYPSRLRRPRHRPFSPPFSDVNRSDSALHGSIHRTYSVRTTSPPSSSSNGKAPPNWYHSFNRSDPLLQRLQTIPTSRRHDFNRSPPFSRRVSRASPPLASYRSSLASKSLAPNSSGSDLTGSRVPSPRPLFYDYSEAFEKETFRHTAQRSSMFIAPEMPRSDGSSEGYQTDVTNTSITVAKQSTSPDESKAATPERVTTNAKASSPLRFVSNSVKHEIIQGNKASAESNEQFAISQEAVVKPAERTVVVKQSEQSMGLPRPEVESLSLRAEMADPFMALPSPRSIIRPPPSAYDPAPKVIKTASISMRLSSSSSGSHYTSSAHSRQGPLLDLSAIKPPQVVYERQPKALSVNFNRLEALRHDALDPEPQQRSASLDACIRPEPLQIFAPVPERSMSSRDSRDRFSRILSVGEDFGKRDLFTNLLPNKKAPITIQQYLRDKKSHSPKSVAPMDKELPPLPDNPPPVPGKGKAKEIIEARDQDTVGQSFSSQQPSKQDADTFSIPGLEHLAALTGFGRPGIPLRYSSISRNSIIDMPGVPQSVRASLISQKPSNEEQPRRLAIGKRNSSLFQAMKELPPLPKEAMVPIPPPQTPSPLELPCAFVPLIPMELQDTAVADMADSPQPDVELTIALDAQQQTPTRRTDLIFNSAPIISDSPASARPWNVDANYPWAGTPPKLEVTLPQLNQDPAPTVQNTSRFKLKIHRSSMLGTVGKLTKNRPPTLTVVHSPGPSTRPVQARFTEQFESGRDGAPTIALAPPSLGFHIEAQSFFSDDSSHKEPKRSLRKRLSQIRGVAMRAASSENIKVTSHGNVATAPGRPKAQIHKSKGGTTTNNNETRSRMGNQKILEKVKSWFHRHEEKVRKWHSRISNKFHRSHALSPHDF
ncbi:MAG: hypothetical protein Q9218_004455 [Villophora microphyllina]